MKVIFMGTPDFAVSTLEEISAAGHEIVLVVTQPDKPKGRGGNMSFPPVKEKAIELGLEVYQPVRVRKPECIEYLSHYEADIIVVSAFGQILPKEILDMPKYCCINVHASLLPKYRGAAPIQWAVINGDEVSGVTIQRMDVGLDTGDIIDMAKLTLDKEETGGSLFDKLAKVGGSLCVSTMEKIEKGQATFTPQKEADATHVGMIDKSMGNIDFQKSAVEIERLIRGLNPWPSAYTKMNGKTLKIWKAKVIDQDSAYAPGQVCFVDKNNIHIQTGKGILALCEVQLEGKKRMDVDAFLRGYKVEEGDL